MKRTLRLQRSLALCSACLGLFLNSPPAPAAVVTWDGAGPDGKWQTGLNWVGGNPPQSGDTLIFTGNTQPVSTNNFGAGTLFTGISFNNPAGIFTLSGNSITLGGDITDNQVISTETIGLPLVLNATHNVNVAANGFLTLGAVVSGAGAGLTKISGGQLNLSGANTFTGPLTINGGTVSISSDSNLGGIPTTPSPGRIVINGGVLQITNSFTINTNRGIALGPVSGSGSGSIAVAVGNTAVYRGIIANAGGTGGLNKLSFGGLTLGGANSYTGPTLVSNGTVTLDFTVTTAPAGNIINTNSSLALGGATSGVGTTNYAALISTPKGNTINSQAFNGTLIDVGPAYIQANSNNAGTMNVSLGSLTHNPGGLAIFLPPTLLGGLGNITTTATNMNGILGGWAFTSGSGAAFGGAPYPTNLAAVDANGNILNYTNYTTWSSGMLNALMQTNNNIMINGSLADVTVDVDHPANQVTTYDVNTISINRPAAAQGASWSLKIGSNNIVRLGKFGAIFSQNPSSSASHTWEIGSSTGGANNTPDQNVGTLTAGGPNYNSPGELVLISNGQSSNSGANEDIDVQIADNGPLGHVTVVKGGSGYIKFRGHNTYSGGTFFLGGRIQFAGTEVGTANPDAVGTGPCYVFPGSYLYNPPAGFTNDLFIAGNGTQTEMFIGALRPGSGVVWSNNITLIGDATIGGSGGVFAGQISGPFNLTLGSGHVISSASQTVSFRNSANNWTGNTIMQTSDHGAGNNIFINANNEVIPNGFGFGNVIMTALTAAETTSWDLHGFNETINGLFTAAGSAIVTITNSTITNSTLVVGDNDASGSFAGIIGGANLSLTKIGGGTETLTATNTYAGITTISNGTLALSVNGSISSSSQILVVGTNNATAFDVSRLTSGFTTAFPVGLNNGTLVGNASVASLSLTNAGLTLLLNPAVTNIVATALTTAGATNFINISAVQGNSGYPTTFPIIKYGTFGGAGNNFAIGGVPSSTTAGFISNDVATSRVLLVLTNGPKPLLWTGSGDLTSWDVATTTNWEAFPGAPSQAASTYHDADSVTFDDTAPGGATNITLVPGELFPSSILFTNNAYNYFLSGAGAISGFTGLTKGGSGTLTVANTGVSDFRGGISVSGGSVVLASDNSIQGGATVAAGSTLQVGLDAGTGTLPSGNINSDGTVIFDRGADLTVPNIIAGAGGLTKLDANVLTLSGANTYTGAVTVASGILRAGSSSALGATNNGTTISSGATLDVNGQNLGNEPVTVGGPGVGNNGVIINSGADQINALKVVTVTGDVIWGGTGRWDIRETTTTAGSESADATLTGTAPYNITKIGPNQVSLDGVQVDNNLRNINVLQGQFDVQLQGTTLGDPGYSLTVSNGATVGLYRLSQVINKPMVLNGDGVATTLINENSANSLSGVITIIGTNIWNIGGTSLTLSGNIGGTGSLNIVGTATLILSGGITISYPGTTALTGGSLVLDSANTGGGTLTIGVGTSLSGAGGNTGPVQIAGAIAPGDTGGPGTFSCGPLTLTNAAMTFRAGLGSDQIAVTGLVTLQGVNTIKLVPTIGQLNSGQQIPIIAYSGPPLGSSATNNLSLLPPPAGYAISLVDPATTPGTIVVSIDHVPQNLTWHGGAPGNITLWDVNATANWYNNNNPPLVTFGVGDLARFDDSGATAGSVTLTNSVQPEDIQFANATLNYTFTGPGKISGGLSPSSTMTLNGGAVVTIANTGTNDYAGTINLFSGTLQVGNGGTGGNLGGGPIVDTTILRFNLSTNLLVTNNISGNGWLQQFGTGVTTLTGNNTNFTGAVLVQSGTLKVGANNSLGTNLTPGTTLNGVFYPNPITITNTGTLDITNGVNINPANNPNEAIMVSGAGAGGNGAIINSSSSATFTTPNFSYATFAGNTTIGGSGRLDWRDASGTNVNAALNTQPSGTPYQLTKVGTNRLQLTGVQIDPAFGHLVVQGGILGIQGVMPSLGEVTSNLVVFSNATLAFFNVSNVMTKNLIMQDGASMLNESGSNTWGGPVTLLGSNSFNIGGNWVLMTAPIGGAGSLYKVTGAAPLFLGAVETYSGPTFVNAGSLCLTNVGAGDGSISLSSEITVASGATLDVIGRSDQTLTVSVGQTLTGSGTVNGALNVGGTLTPGSPTGVLTVSNSAVLGGSALLAVQKTSQTNAQLRTITGNITFSGTLAVTNLGGNMKGGETFKLFSSGGGSYLGSFTSIQLPLLGPGLSWNTSALATSGTISVTGTLLPPAIGSISYSAPTLGLSGTGGTPYGTYVVVTSTNVALALSHWTPVVTNTFDASGNFNWSGSVGSTNATQFFNIRE